MENIFTSATPVRVGKKWEPGSHLSSDEILLNEVCLCYQFDLASKQSYPELLW